MRSFERQLEVGFKRVGYVGVRMLDGDIDDRDSGVLETSRGTLLVTTFTSLAYEKVLQVAEKKKAGEPGAWPAERLKLWEAAHNRLTAEQRQSQLGQWMIRSTDGGVTWSPRYSSIVNSPHGPIELAAEVAWAWTDPISVTTPAVAAKS